jgi:hypothetical protein
VTDFDLLRRIDLAAVGADGMIIVGPADPAAIGPIGQALAEAFPG